MSGNSEMTGAQVMAGCLEAAGVQYSVTTTL